MSKERAAKVPYRKSKRKPLARVASAIHTGGMGGRAIRVHMINLRLTAQERMTILALAGTTETISELLRRLLKEEARRQFGK